MWYVWFCAVSYMFHHVKELYPSFIHRYRHNFSKAQLISSEETLCSCKKVQVSSSPPFLFLLKAFCFPELFPASVISSFSTETPPPPLANICVVRGGEILEALVYFRIKRTSSLPALLPSYVHSLSSQQHTHRLCLFLVKFSQASLCHKRQQMSLSPSPDQ